MKQPEKKNNTEEVPPEQIPTEKHTEEPPKQVFDEKLSLVATRPPGGKAGKAIDVITNSFVVNIPLDQIYLYTIEFTPDIPEDAVEQRLSAVNQISIRNEIISAYGPYFFENKHLLCLRKKEGESQFANEDLSQTVTVKFLKPINLKDLTAGQIEQHEQVVHWMLNKVIRGSELIRIGANYFERNEPLFSGEGKFDIKLPNCPPIRIWRGYSISCERKIGGIHMSVDCVHRVLHQKSVGEKIDELFKMSKGNNKLARKRAEEMVNGNVVITIYNRRLYRVSGIDWNVSANDTFLKDGKKITYADYFKSTYNEEIDQDFKGMLVHEPKQRRKKGKSPLPDKIYLPPSLCHETGLSRKLKSNYMLMKKIAETTRIRAPERHRLRTRLVGRLQSTIGLENSYDTESAEGSQKGKVAEVSSSPAREVTSSPTVVTTDAHIPVILGKKAVSVSARILPQFKMSIADQNNKVREVNPYTELQRGWNTGKFINQKIIKIRKWAIIGDSRKIINTCVTQLVNAAQNANLLNSYIAKNPVASMVVNQTPNDRLGIKAWRDALVWVKKESRPDIILAVLPDERRGNPTAVYNLVKTYCCTEDAVLSQCITNRNVMNMRRAGSVFKGCLKQMLTKVGNTPWRANFALPDDSINLREPTMICGMDVNHDMRRNCSTVSFVASYSPHYTKYHTFVYHQKFGREVMIESGALMGEALKEFYARNKVLPKNIIVYRDGVSTAQLPVIVLHEVRSFKERFSKIKVEGVQYQPKLSVIVTQKNVSARFIDKKFNSLQPGTVIDTEVVSSKFWDFYLVPCTATNLNSSASPSRFIVAFDDIGFTQDDISALTNQLCNMYFNIAAAVRVPAPIQYAHKIAHMFGTAIENKKPCKELIGKPFFL